MLKSAHNVSASEMRLLEAIDALEFGEITDIQVDDTPRNLDANLGEKQLALLEYIRKGHPHIDKLIVHDSIPMQVETILLLAGYQCTRKLRV